VGADRAIPVWAPQRLGCEGAKKFFAAARPLPGDRRATGSDDALVISAPLVLRISTLAYPRMREMVWFAGRWWWFPGRQITAESQFEWKNGRAYLLKPDGSAIEGVLFAGEVATE
jgi:hypothetical protein